MIIADVAKRLLNSTDPSTLGRTLAQLLDIKGLSKELAQALIERAVKQKDLVIEALAHEFSVFLAKINIAEEAQKVLEGMTLNIEASINFKDKKISAPLRTKVAHSSTHKKRSRKSTK